MLAAESRKSGTDPQTGSAPVTYLTINSDRKFRKPLRARIIEHKYALLMCLPFVVWVGVFIYAPVWGWLMAFQNYNPGKGIFGSEWVGLRYFIRFFRDPSFYLVMRNTISLASLNIINFTVWPIAFAIFLNELPSLRYKKTIQTVSYLPHFVSFVVVSSHLTKTY